MQSWRADNSMAVILWVMGFSLLMQGCLCSPEQRGCMKWTQKEGNVCCDLCHPGNRLVQDCGRNPKDLCTPCEPNTFTVKPKDYRCYRCTQCVGALVLVEECTATKDTKCGCKEGLVCGNGQCSFCVKECGKGHEPAENRFCRPCPDGTFNDQIHQKCKPWSTKCPNPDQKIVAFGDAFTDIKCANVSFNPVKSPKQPDYTEQPWPFVLSVVTSVVLMGFSIIIIIVVVKVLRKRKEKGPKKPQIPKTPIIRTPTDDPATLIAIECSFHEAQQEQGSSSESLASKDSSEQLIA
ncbi:tumor necrosis factor receptor superfamily member 9-like isoform X2 [Micropterus dolomieu]|uniref:tumor necrosis factor receptor superfamily member 9-like isoform X2 n=1 Tax=Micropterus dolomieu TaxID=147949 RepID=UPI001E8E0405|nr:tumor necrosis factor receptor superfamily member 9-like isoform X2 [Micropterus dolomieu]